MGLSQPAKVHKRDGSEQAFDVGKIRRAVLRAVEEVEGGDASGSVETIDGVVEGVVAAIAGREEAPGVEEIQDIVEQALMQRGMFAVAKAYIIYRQRRTDHRQHHGVSLKDLEPISTPWGEIGYVTYKRTYSRRIPGRDDGDTEEFEDTIRRVLEACQKQLKVNLSKAELEQARRFFLELKCSVAGRFLWQLGTPTVDRCGLASLQNCAFIVIDKPIQPFLWIFDMLMLGCGVGFNVQRHYVDKLPPVVDCDITITRKDTKDADFIIPDSREGWVKLLEQVLEAFFVRGRSFTYSATLVRSKGTPINGFGGVSSGPEDLCKGIQQIADLLNRRRGKKLSSVDCLDVVNIIASIVVSGNVRRCLPGNALVHLRGGLVPIKDVRPGAEVLTYNGYRKVTEHMVQGSQRLVKVVTQDGVFKCTPNHRMAVMTGVDAYTFREASELQPGDRLMTSRTALDGMSTHLPPAWQACSALTVPDLDADMAWFLGLFGSDGYVYEDSAHAGAGAYVSLSMANDERRIGDIAAQQMQRFGADLDVVMRMSADSRSCSVRCESKQLACYFGEEIKRSGVDVVVPPVIMYSKQNVRLAYIAGVIDAGGCVGTPSYIVTSTSFAWVKSIQSLAYACGIETRLVETLEPSTSRSGGIILMLRFYKLAVVTQHTLATLAAIPQLQRKKICVSTNAVGQAGYTNDVPAHWISLDPATPYSLKLKANAFSGHNVTIDAYDANLHRLHACPVSVVGVEPCDGEEPTYDISVEDRHEFFCDGYLTHNSALICLGDHDDVPYIQAKRWDLGNIPNWRAMSNNSVVCSDIDSLPAEFWDGYNGLGEPYGLINLELSRKVGRLADGGKYPDPDVQGYNPCLTGDTLVLTTQGLVPVRMLEGRPFVAVVDGEAHPSTAQGFWLTGRRAIKRVTLANGCSVRATGNHRFLTASGEWVQVDDLVPGKTSIVLSDNSKYEWERTASAASEFDRGFAYGRVLFGQMVGPDLSGVAAEHKIGGYSAGLRRGIFGSSRELVVSGDMHSALTVAQAELLARGVFTDIRAAGDGGGSWAMVETPVAAASLVVDVAWLPRPEEVYDCTIPGVHRFSANGMVSHNCAEQPLASHETCCLSEIFLPNVTSYDELVAIGTLLYRICKHSLMLPCHHPETEAVVHRNMRMGIGVTGYLQTTEEQKTWLPRLYEHLRAYDEVYSGRLGVNRSIKLTTSKPSGTLSLLPGVTPGWHPAIYRHYIRRMRMSSNSPLVELCKRHGYHTEYQINFDGTADHGTIVVEFPCRFPDHATLAADLSAIDELEIVKRLQTEWSDNAVSCTIYYRNHELEGIKDWLRKHYRDSVKSVSFLLHYDHGFKQAPYEEISAERYHELKARVRPIARCSGAEAPEDIDPTSTECRGGMCPIK